MSSQPLFFTEDVSFVGINLSAWKSYGIRASAVARNFMDIFLYVLEEAFSAH